MFYNIIFPIIVVASLGLVVFVIARKAFKLSASEKAKLEEIKREEIVADEAAGKKGKLFFLKKIGLGIVEGVLRLVRFILGKINASISGWVHRIKRKKIESAQQQTESAEKPDMPEENVPKEKETPKDAVESFFEPVRPVERPLLEDKITVPDNKKSAKGLEEILIERIAMDPRDVEAYERLGDYYMEAQNYKEAKECFKYVMKLAPLNRDVRAKLRRLERLLVK